MSMQAEERTQQVENDIVLKDMKNEGKKNEDVLMNNFLNKYFTITGVHMYNSENERVYDEDGHPGCVNIALAAINIDGSR